jgi:hypothetical protein
MQLQLVHNIIDSFDSIGLGELGNMSLMNRIDSKYVLASNRIPDILQNLAPQYCSLNINAENILSYHNVYLDTPGYYFYNQHVTLRYGRNKVRFRTYECTGETFLEIKKRTRQGRTLKWRFENMPGVDYACNSDGVEFINKHIGSDLPPLNAVIMNNFKRITLVGKGFAERATIDFDLSFSDLKGTTIELPFLSIIELKRERANGRSELYKTLKNNLIRPIGFSKYCIGASLLNNGFRKNILKSKYLLINKIENEYYRSIRK